MKNLICLILIFISNSLLGQSLNVDYKSDLTILRDSLWIKYKLWKEANLSNVINSTPIYFDSNLSKINFIDIPVFKFKPEASKYDYGLDLVSFLEKDNSGVCGFIVKNDTIVGQIMGFKRNNIWMFRPLWTFPKESFPYFAYERLNIEIKKSIFTIVPIGFLWYKHNDSTYVIVPGSKNSIPAEKLIRDYVTLETIRKDYSQNKYGGVINIYKEDHVIVGPIRKDSIKHINNFDTHHD